MAPLAYCESCGAHLPSDQPQFATAGGVRCQACAAAEPDGEPAPEAAEDAFTQFPCCYCRSLLRLKPVAKRTRIRCPRCDDHFYLHPDGRVEAKLEGSTTAVMATPQLTPPLTPAAGTRASPTSQGAVAPAEPPPDKTQPLKRLTPGEDQSALLEGLKPRRMDFLENVPDRPKDEPQVDLSAYAARTPSRTAPRPAPPALPTRPAAPPDSPEDSGPLELLPQDVGPGAAPARPRPARLRDSEEGQVDLGAEELKRKTKKYVKGAGAEAEPSATRTTKRRAREDGRTGGSAPELEPVPSSRRTTEKRKVEPEPPPSARGADDRDKRAAEAAARAKELERQQARGALGSGVLLLLVIAPLGIALLLVSMTTRGAGFATRGVFGEKLRDVGAAADRGVRSFGATVNPALPPEVLRLPEPERR